MSRRLRIHLPGGFYHVTLRGNHRKDIFSVETDRLLLNTIVELALAKHGASLHAYCWMTNHMHMLVQIGEEPLGALMRRIASGYARSYQANLDTTGHLFEKRYHAVLVDTDSYFTELLRYIHLNPVSAGMSKSVAQYRWTSHHRYIGAAVDSWVTTDFGLRMFSASRRTAVEAYHRFVDCDPAEIASPYDHIDPEQPEILGSPAFRERLTPQLGLPASKRSLDSLIAEACARFGLQQHQLTSTTRNARVAAARAWMTRSATESRIASMTEVARKLGCDPKTLRRALEKCAAPGADGENAKSSNAHPAPTPTP